MGLASFNRARRLAKEKQEKQEKQEVPIDELISKLTELKADDIKKVAAHFEVKYTNKEQTIIAIQERLEPSEEEKENKEG